MIDIKRATINLGYVLKPCIKKKVLDFYEFHITGVTDGLLNQLYLQCNGLANQYDELQMENVKIYRFYSMPPSVFEFEN